MSGQAANDEEREPETLDVLARELEVGDYLPLHGHRIEHLDEVRGETVVLFERCKALTCVCNERFDPTETVTVER